MSEGAALEARREISDLLALFSEAIRAEIQWFLNYRKR
jgi:hypothetical protein